MTQYLSFLLALALQHYQKPLIIACCSGDLGELKRLHDLGLTLNYSDPEQGTPLHIAVGRRDRPMAMFILRDPEPCDPNMTDSQGMTSLQLACQHGDHDMIKILLNATGVDVDKLSKHGAALFIACNAGDVEAVELLLGAGADATTTLNGSTLLHVAAKIGISEIAATVLERNINVNRLDTDGKSALMIASQNCDKVMVSLLLGKGADPELAGIAGSTALHSAAANNALDVLTLLVDATGGHLTLTDEGKSLLDIAQEAKSTDVVVHLLCSTLYFVLGEPGSSPLHLACENDDAVVYKMLAKHPVDLELQDKYGRTALHLACEKGKLQIVDYFVNSGADTWAVDINKETPLHKASSKGHREIVVLLLETGIDVNSACRSHATPLHRACANDHYDVVEELLNHGADPTRKDNLGRTAQDIATNQDIIEALLKKSPHERKAFQPGQVRKTSLEENTTSKGLKGIHLNLSAPMMVRTHTKKRAAFLGRTPLHEAAENGERHVVRYRVDHKASVNVYDINGDTPLHLALANGHSEVCEILVADGKAVVNAKNRHGQTPLSIAAKKGYQTIVKNLLDYGADANLETPQSERPLMLAVREGNEGVVNVLFSRKCSLKVDHRNPDGETALHIAAQAGNAGICRALLDKKADPNATRRNGETPIFGAIKGGHAQVVRILLEMGAKKSVKGSFGKRPLHIAVLEENEEIVKILLTKKANPNSKDADDVTPLYIAATRGNEGIVKLLLKHGADVNAKIARSGETPLHTAARAGVASIVQMLLQRGAKPNVANAVGRLPEQEDAPVEIKDIIKLAKRRRANDTFKGLEKAASEVGMNIAGSALLLIGGSLDSNNPTAEAGSSDEDNLSGRLENTL